MENKTLTSATLKAFKTEKDFTVDELIVLTEKFSTLGYSGNIIHKPDFVIFEWFDKEGVKQAPLCELFKLVHDN